MNRLTMLVQADLAVPFSDADELRGCGGFALVLPVDDEIASRADLSTIVVARVYLDSDYFSQRDLDPSSEAFHFHLDIASIRETRLSGVTDREWGMCYGPNGAWEYMESIEGAGPSTPVKVVLLQPLRHDLAALAALVDAGASL